MGLHRDLNLLIETLEADESGQTDNDLMAEDLRVMAGNAAVLERQLDALRREIEQWRAAWGPFGPQTPDEVRVFLEEGSRVSAEVAAHENELRKNLEAECERLRNELRARI